MQIRASETIDEGDLVCLATGPDGATVLLRWRFGCEAIGIAGRPIAEDDMVEYSPDKSSDDVLVKGSGGPAHNKTVALKVACDLKMQDLVCLKLLSDGKILLDKWVLGEEAIGVAARNIKADEMVEYCEDKSTGDILVRPQ
ncbi:MAG: hypothetical protein C0623_10490 [Desulfuromonas sp.]|nr:MAG: hypothetical protein C0623_10490 [Desulfuromonas sp.]